MKNLIITICFIILAVLIGTTFITGNGNDSLRSAAGSVVGEATEAIDDIVYGP